MRQDNRPVIVSIQCMVFNHEPYLRDCLNGFVMQKTNFRFEAIVHDDCSTDNSADIIREYAEKYPEIIKPIFEKENQYSKHDGSIEKVTDKFIKGKYIAKCEGDDYWTDPFKLQKQVDFLEEHPDYSVCTHNFRVLKDGIIASKTNYNNLNFNDDGYLTYTIDDYFGDTWYTQTLTALIRFDAFFSDIPNKKYKYYRDTIFYYYILKKGKGALLEDCMGVYRKTSTGVFAGSPKIKVLNILYRNYTDILKIEKDKRAYRGIANTANDIFLLYVDEHKYHEALVFFIKYMKDMPSKHIVESLTLYSKVFATKIIKKLNIK